MACNSDNRTIARVVFTATGKAQACPDNDREWVQPLGTSGFVQGPVCIHGDIFTREDFYAPEESEGQAEPPTVDLREMVNIVSMNPYLKKAIHAIINRLEAQEKSIKKHEDRLEAQRRDVGAFERWVKGFETP